MEISVVFLGLSVILYGISRLVQTRIDQRHLREDFENPIRARTLSLWYAVLAYINRILFVVAGLSLLYFLTAIFLAAIK